MIRVSEIPFDPAAELGAFAATLDDQAGGYASFVGSVRAGTGPGRVRAMTLEHYPGMTERKLAEIEAEARARFSLLASLVIHRVGRMEPGQPIVLVAAASAHRQAAFEACQFLMDWLKTKAPFWKLEETEDGAHWVGARESDDEAAARWEA
jgi:molybdopterin synthase catalytic subunit